MSRFHPGMAPLKTGVARIVSDTLTAQKDQEDFELTLLTCSITYMHRERFRSDVLISFNPPLKLRPKVSVLRLQLLRNSQVASSDNYLHRTFHNSFSQQTSQLYAP
jgi:glycerol-3-phosphate O-acyltransferase / dihydroxyacetone phosphate acyltransferase